MLKEIVHHLAGAMVLSKPNTKKTFWGVHIDHTSSLLTKLNMHRRQYILFWMDFGLK